MSLDANKPQKLLLSFVIAGLSSTSYASDYWNCATDANGQWDCTANPNPPPEPSFEPRISESESGTQSREIVQPATDSSDARQEVAEAAETETGETSDAPTAPAPVQEDVSGSQAIVAAPAVVSAPEGSEAAAPARQPAQTPVPAARAEPERLARIEDDSVEEQVAQSTAGIPSGGWSCVLTPDGQWDCTIDPNGTPQRFVEPATLPRTEPALVERAPLPSTEQSTQPALPAERRPATRPVISSAPDTGSVEAFAIAPPPNLEEATPSGRERLADTTPPEELVASDRTLAAEPSAPVRTEPLEGDDRRDRNLDWVTLAASDSGSVCKGQYLEPDIWRGDLAPGQADSPTFIDADQYSSELEGLTVLEGRIVLQEAGREVRAEYGEFDRNNRQGILRTDVRYREPGFLLTSDALSVDLQNDTTIANEARYVLHAEHLRGESLTLTRTADRTILSEQSRVTFCEPGNNDWAIAADEMKLYPEEGYGESWDTTFEVAGVPVFYLPYFYFPLDDRRRSGFLYPSISNSDKNGFDLAIPYYFNIAPNYDDTLTARYIEERGLMLENEFRYLNPFSLNQLNTSFLPDDDLTGEDRWLFNFDHRGSFAQRWSSLIDFTRVSDDDYFDDLEPVQLRVPTADDLSQRAALTYSGDSWTANALVHDYQTIDGGTEPYTRMPQLTLSGSQTYLETGLINTELNYLAQYTEFDSDTLNDGTRLHLRPSVEYRYAGPWGFIEPELGLWHSSYDLSAADASGSDSPSRTLTFASVDSGLVFERPAGSGVQTLEPRAKLIYVDGDSTNQALNFDSSALGFSYNNLFDTLGFTGNDRVAETQQVTLGLQSRLYSNLGREVFSAGVAQAYYFDNHDARPGDSTGRADESNFAVNAAWRPSESWQLSHDSELDKDDGRAEIHNYRMLYTPDNDRLLYANLRVNERTPSKQIDLATRWPLGGGWSAVARWTEDLEAKENLETLIGAEYESCCWKVRLTAQRYVTDSNTNFERDNAIYLQFVLRGLGSFGQSEGRSFLEDLTGYDEDANDNF